MVNNKCSKCGVEIPAGSKFCVDCGTTQDEAQNIIRTRYAKGEITKKEYAKKKKVLQK
jgi:uncharacterized membrane protein